MKDSRMKLLTILAVLIPLSYQYALAQPEAQNLRKRQHSISYSTELKKSTVATGGSSIGGGSSQDVDLKYTYNFGFYEVGGLAAVQREKDDSGTKYDANSLGIVGVINFIENKAGNNLIPYISAAFMLGQSSDNASDDYDTFGSKYQIGFKWFPFGEIFAVDASLFGQGFGNKSTNNHYDLTESGLNLGWSLYF